MCPQKSEPRMDKTAFAGAPLGADPGDKEFWRTKTPLERLEAMEFMRQVMYGYDPATDRLQRVLESAPLSRR